MNKTYLIAPMALMLAACSAERPYDLHFSPKCLQHSLTFESGTGDTLDLEFKEDPTQDPSIHIVVTPDNLRYQLFDDGRITALADYVEPELITSLDINTMPKSIREHSITFIEYANDGKYALAFNDNSDVSTETHLVVMPDGSRFRIDNDGVFETVREGHENDAALAPSLGQLVKSR
jgi:hypothetical protein